MSTVSGIVNNWFVNLPPSPLAQAAARHGLISDLEAHVEVYIKVERESLLNELRAKFAEVDADGSSNDVVQMLDDFLTSRGLPTVLYR